MRKTLSDFFSISTTPVWFPTYQLPLNASSMAIVGVSLYEPNKLTNLIACGANKCGVKLLALKPIITSIRVLLFLLVRKLKHK
jgi:hypothetical protein